MDAKKKKIELHIFIQFGKGIIFKLLLYLFLGIDATNVGDEGGFAPPVTGNFKPFS